MSGSPKWTRPERWETHRGEWPRTGRRSSEGVQSPLPAILANLDQTASLSPRRGRRTESCALGADARARRQLVVNQRPGLNGAAGNTRTGLDPKTYGEVRCAGHLPRSTWGSRPVLSSVVEESRACFFFSLKRADERKKVSGSVDAGN